MRAKISETIRYQAVGEVLAGAKISDVARRYDVNRASIYRWVKLSRQAIRRSLGSADHERRQEHLTRRTTERKIAGLRRELEKKSALIKELRKELRKKTEGDPRPDRCPECGCEKVYKNGFYYQPLSKIIPPQIYFEKKIPVKRFICPACHNSTFLEFPDILHHWLKSAARKKTAREEDHKKKEKTS